MFLTSSLSKHWPTVFFILALSFTSLDNVYSKNILADPDSIPFAPPVSYRANDSPYSIFCADLDGDSDLDLVVTGYMWTNVVSIFKNRGDGTFQNRVDYNVGEYATSIFCADLDGDSDLDLVVGYADSTVISVLKNNGDGSFQPKVDYQVGLYPISVFCADLDGDGDQDLAVASHEAGG
ncbi:MAG TPA: FG-GAP-like repeat-containing protein, partial [Terriglobales bacterium]|nr:FG-GAP-like repeat-containing protein [Terriglobales bacterium]